MTGLTLMMTRAGQARFTAAQLDGNVELRIATVGLTTEPFVVAPTLDALPGEFLRLDMISGAVVGDDTVHLTIRDDEARSYTVSGFGLFLSDGTLFATYGQADPIFEKSVLASMLVAIDIVFPTADIDRLSFGDANFLYPPGTTATKGVVQLATQTEVDAGTDPAHVVTPLTLSTRLLALTQGLVAAIAQAVSDYVPLAQKAKANGVATLDANARIPTAQLPDSYIPTSQRAAANGVATLDANAHIPTGQLPVIIQPGTITLFFGANAPAGWAICNGQVAPWMDGSGNVTTPDLRGRVAVGASADHALGTIFGQTSAPLSIDQAATGVTLNYTTNTSYAGNGSQAAIAASPTGAPPSITDAGHSHGGHVDVTQPSLALHYIMKL